MTVGTHKATLKLRGICFKCLLMFKCNHTFSAEVVSNCSRAIQVCLECEWIIYESSTVFLSLALPLHNDEGKSLWWKLLLHGDVTNTGQKFSIYTHSTHLKTHTLKDEAFERMAYCLADLLKASAIIKQMGSSTTTNARNFLLHSTWLTDQKKRVQWTSFL